MQIYALDKSGNLTVASRALKHHDYFCLECNNPVRLRKGIQRQPHYYHLQPTNTCRQSGKGLAHLLTQYHLKELLPKNEAHLEYRFDAISRIADVAWLSQRLIFEIQYSPITAAEVESRNKDYASLGFQVVWILHDERYNQPIIKSAESFLINSPHYFTNMDEKGNGMIYDQHSLKEDEKRIDRLPRLRLNLSVPKWMNEIDHEIHQRLPKSLTNRLVEWKICFEGDSIDLAFNRLEENHSFLDGLKKMIDFEEKKEQQLFWDYLRQLFQRFIAAPYRAVLHLFIERACR